MTPAPLSVYQRVLGPSFDALSPELKAYFSLPPDDMVGLGSGTYDEAGSRLRWLTPLFAFLGWRHILFPEYARDVPFEVINIPGPGDGLSARRDFTFTAADGTETTRTVEDTMHVIDGRLHDFLGRRRGLEVRFTLTVADGGLTMVSDRTWVHVKGLRIPVPPILSARVTVNERWDGDAQRVDVGMRHPVLGEIFVYGGRFTYRYA